MKSWDGSNKISKRHYEIIKYDEIGAHRYIINEIKYEEIKENVDNHRCPGMFLCTVATTCYEEDERKARCLRCGLDTMKERNIEVLYNEEE